MVNGLVSRLKNDSGAIVVVDFVFGGEFDRERDRDGERGLSSLLPRRGRDRVGLFSLVGRRVLGLPSLLPRRDLERDLDLSRLSLLDLAPLVLLLGDNVARVSSFCSSSCSRRDCFARLIISSTTNCLLKMSQPDPPKTAFTILNQSRIYCCVDAAI